MIDRSNFPGGVHFIPGIAVRNLGKFTDVEPQAPFTPAVNETGANARFMTLDPLANGKPFFQKEALEAITQPTGIGDINSDAKGSGARFNSGKPDLSLIPLVLLAVNLRRSHPDSIYVDALEDLGHFQETHDTTWLHRAIENMGLDGWDDCAHVFTYGAKKYAAHNWAKGMAWSVPLACAARHLVKLINGQTTDDESGKPERGHVFCNITMLLQYTKTFTEGNDLPPKGLL